MGAPLRYAPLFQHQYLVGILNGRKPVSDHKDRFPFGQALKCYLDFVFVFRISEGGCFIQQNDRGIFEYSPRKRYTLLLSAGEVDTLRA